MIYHEIQIRVRYAETDQMGYVYYGNYATYLEVARVETIRKIGFTYKALEEEGILMPVLELKVKYIKPAYYDDLLTIKTWVRELPSARIKFEYDIENQDGQLLTKAETTLVFISKESGRPCSLKGRFAELMEQQF